MKLGAFYPFARDHSAINTNRRELYLWDSVARSARKALGLRYRLLPYFYTLMYEAHVKGTPIARPLFFSFPEDVKTYDISTQFLIGKGVMVSPVLTQGAVSVDAYFPKGKWFNLFNYSLMVSSDSGKYVMLDAPEDTTNVHVRGGNILAMQEEAMTINLARQSGFKLLVVLDEDNNASGEVYLDDGEVVEMASKQSQWSFVKFSSVIEDEDVKVRSEVVNGSYALNQKFLLEKVVFLGLESKETPKMASIFFNGMEVSGNSEVSARYQTYGGFGVAEIEGLSQLIGEEFELKFKLTN